MLSKSTICLITFLGVGLCFEGCVGQEKNTTHSEGDHNKDEVAYLVFCKLIDGGGGDRKEGTIWIEGPENAEAKVKERFGKTVQIRYVENRMPGSKESVGKKDERAPGFVVKDISIRGDEAEAYGGSREGWFRFKLNKVSGIWSIESFSVEAAF